MYEVRISHDGLHKYRVVKGYTAQEAELKAALQQQAWDEQWQKVVQRRDSERQKTNAAIVQLQKKTLAAEHDVAAANAVAAMDSILRDAVPIDHTVEWSKLKINFDFNTPKPPPLDLQIVPPAPAYEEPIPRLGILGFIPSIRESRIALARQQARSAFHASYAKWEAWKLDIERRNERLKLHYESALQKYETERDAFHRLRQKLNEHIDQKRQAYLKRLPDMVAEYCEFVLDSSLYPESFPSSFDVEYISDTRTVVVDFALPPIEALPQVKGYKYVASRNEIQAMPVSDAWLKKTYDSVLYQITLRTLYELAQADTADAIDSIVFNGWVNSIDKATGQEVNACVVTVHAKKDEILEINMAQVDPKACFKKLKGVSAAKLVNLSPVRPILQLSKDDKRFVPAHDVVDGLDESANLAAMDWEEFEHLIRELFEKEFSANGGEVKITQASRDGGVDAIAFDEDPIRGGKIVIQAKRYTNTVSVSAVRDLYGTILNEGANKGILVTTADYGPDAYEFAKGKPITLLSGNELLYLLQKHGRKARINLSEARALAAQQASTAKTSS